MNILKATKRATNSSGQINKLRSDGFIPAVLYGGKKDNVNLSLKKLHIENIIKTETFMSKVVDLDIDVHRHQQILVLTLHIKLNDLLIQKLVVL